MRLQDWHVQIPFRELFKAYIVHGLDVLPSSGPESLYMSAPSPFFHWLSCVRKRRSRALNGLDKPFRQDAHLLLDRWNIGFINA